MKLYFKQATTFKGKRIGIGYVDQVEVDKDGNYANVIQGHDNIQDVINSPEPYLSTLIGRYGNRICKGRFQLGGKVYQLPINDGENSLHGGNEGFNKKVWDALRMNDETVVLNYVSSYGEEGFSGEVKDRRISSRSKPRNPLLRVHASHCRTTLPH